MNKYLNKTDSIRMVVYSMHAVFAVYALFFGPSAIQSRNMKRARAIEEQIDARLSLDESYSQIRTAVSTGNLGRNLLIIGNVPTQEKLDMLTELIDEEFQDDVIKIKLLVRVHPVEIDETDNQRLD